MLLFNDANCLFTGLLGNFKVFRSISRAGISRYMAPDVPKCFRMFIILLKSS